MQIQNLQIFNSTAAADGAWIDISNLVSFSVQIVGGLGTGVWIEVSNDPNVMINNTASPLAAPSAPLLSQYPYGALKDQGTIYIQLTYVTAWGETTASTTSSLAVNDGYQLLIASPTSTIGSPPATVSNGAIGWNVYASQTGSAGTFVLQTPPQFHPQHSVDSTGSGGGVSGTGGVHYAISGALPFSQNFSMSNGFQNTGIVPPAINQSGTANVGINVCGSGNTFITGSATDSPIAVLVDSNLAQVIWSPSCMVWKWLRVRKSGSSTQTTAYLVGQRG
jgi:hypothetical protein